MSEVVTRELEESRILWDAVEICIEVGEGDGNRYLEQTCFLKALESHGHWQT